ncbi:MAG: hypothetical protein MUO34_09425 [Ignavibacteriaceae bacterium]|nr:hypothetical protein [Ignavibacteriaceae bacterium]
MNKNQKMILIVAILLVAVVLIYWQIQGGEIFTKTQVLVEKADGLFNITYKEWEDKFVLGLDYAGAVSGAIVVLSGFLIYLFRNKRKENQ